MTRRADPFEVRWMRLPLAALLALAPVSVHAQDGQFDLRTRPAPAPTPTSTTAGPVDPDSPAVARPRPAPSPTASLPPLVVPEPTATQSPAEPIVRGPAAPRVSTPGPAQSARPSDSPAASNNEPVGTQPVPTQSPPASSASPGAYQPRQLDRVAETAPVGLWLVYGFLGLLAVAGGWLIWSRWFGIRVGRVQPPEIERPLVPQEPVAANPGSTASTEAPPQTPPAPAVEPAPLAEPAGIEVVLSATRLTATLLNTTLSYRLSVTNRSTGPLREVRIDGDMVAAHANRKLDDLFGPYAAVLPPLHRIEVLAPGETVELTGDIRLPLVEITPIRRGEAAFFVPLARVRARGTSQIGLSVEGGGTFLVGQEPGANRKLQPFRLDLGPRNYSNLGQQLLRAA